MELQKLIEELTYSKNDYLDDVKCHELKVLCRMSKCNTARAFYIIWTGLEKCDSRVRLLSVQLIDVLFCRSSLFRGLLLQCFQDFVKFTLGIGPKSSLPPPKLIANKLKYKTTCIIKNWFDRFGDSCKRLKLAYNFLKDCKGVRFDDPEFNNHMEELSDRQKREIESTTKVNVATEQLKELKPDIVTCIGELQSCLDLLIPKPSEFKVFSVDDITEIQESNIDNHIDYNDENSDSYEAVSGDENEDCRSFPLRLHGITTQRMHLVLDFDENHLLTVKKSEDNADILFTMREKMFILSERYLPLIKGILDIFVEFKSTSEGFNDAINLQKSMELILGKAKKIDIQDSDESDYDDFIEVFPFETKDFNSENSGSHYLKHFASTSCHSEKDSLKVDKPRASKNKKGKNDARNRRICRRFMKSLDTNH